MVFFGVIHVFPPLSWIGIFGAKSAYLHLKSPNFQEVFLSKPNTILKRKQCYRSCSFQHRWFSLQGNVFLQLTWIGLLHANRAYLHLQSPTLLEIILSKTTSIVTRIKVLNAAACSIHEFLEEEHVLLPLSWIGLFGANTAYLHLEIPRLQEAFLSKTDTILTWKQCARCSCF
jgi:hypothetical protein